MQHTGEPSVRLQRQGSLHTAQPHAAATRTYHSGTHEQPRLVDLLDKGGPLALRENAGVVRRHELVALHRGLVLYIVLVEDIGPELP